MKRLAVRVLLVAMFLVTTSSFAYTADKVVVIPLNSSSPIYVAGTEITSVPYTITNPGFYFITQDLTCTNMAVIDYCIKINVSNVTLDLMGFSLIGDPTSNVNGIKIVADYVEIRNGTVRNFLKDGIYSSYKGIKVFKVKAIENNNDGIDIGTNSEVRECVAMGNVLNGINVNVQSNVIDNISNENQGTGIEGSGRSRIIGNQSSNNYTGMTTSLSTQVIGNVVNNNTANGMELGNGNLVDQNVVVNNGSGQIICTSCTYGTNQ